MENDSIRPGGSNTLVDIWIDGKLRAISISKAAIGAFLGFDRVATMSDEDRCEFVRSHLSLVVSAAQARLRESPTAALIVIDGPQLGNLSSVRGDRRKADRRKGDRRKQDVPRGDLPDRRRGDRRRGDRRADPPKPD